MMSAIALRSKGDDCGLARGRIDGFPEVRPRNSAPKSGKAKLRQISDQNRKFIENKQLPIQPLYQGTTQAPIENT